MYLEEESKTKSNWKQNLFNFISEAENPEESNRLNAATVKPMTDILKSSYNWFPDSSKWICGYNVVEIL